MNYIWAGMMIISLLCALLTGRGEVLSAGLVEGAGESVELLLSILGIMCFWSGMMEIGRRSGLTDMLARLFSPILSLLFPKVPRDSTAMKYMSLNISANLLGLGSAATPFGLKAIKELHRLGGERDEATDSMLLFVVMNTASIQLFPTTLGAYRATYGSEAPFDILPSVWVSSLAALMVGVTVAKVFSCACGHQSRLRG